MLERHDAILGGPDHERRPVEAAKPLGRGDRTVLDARSRRARTWPGRAGSPGSESAGASQSSVTSSGNRALRHPAEGEREPPQRPQAQRLERRVDPPGAFAARPGPGPEARAELSNASQDASTSRPIREPAGSPAQEDARRPSRSCTMITSSQVEGSRNSARSATWPAWTGQRRGASGCRWPPSGRVGTMQLLCGAELRHHVSPQRRRSSRGRAGARTTGPSPPGVLVLDRSRSKVDLWHRLPPRPLRRPGPSVPGGTPLSSAAVSR